MHRSHGFFQVIKVWLLLLFATALLFSHPVRAAITEQITFYGTLQDSSGNNLAGTYDMVFRFYDAASGGTLLDTSTHTAGNGNPVTVTNGEFRVVLGSGAGNALDGLDFDTTPIYVGLSVESDPEMTPRELLTAAAYAFNSDSVDGYEAYQLLRYNATGSITASDAATLFTITQNGTGDIFNVFDGASEVLTITDGGNVGIGGVAAPNRALVVGGDVRVNGALRDVTDSAGTSGQVLQSTGAGWQWVATSSLGLGGGGSSLFTDGGATTYLTATGDNLAIGDTAATAKLSVSGNINLASAAAGLHQLDVPILTSDLADFNYTLGHLAGETFTSATDRNIAIGYAAGRYASTTFQDDGVYIGHQAGQNESGGSSILIGYQAGINNAEYGNIAIGYQAGENNTGWENVIIGYTAGTNSTQDGSVMVGGGSGALNSSGYGNTSVGYLSGWSMRGDYNVAIGEATANAARGDYNTMLGAAAGANASGTQSIYVGRLSGQFSVGDNNILMGYRSGRTLDTSDSIFIGRDAGYSLDTSTSSVIIGSQAQGLIGAAGNGAGFSVLLGARSGYSGAGLNNILIGYQAGDDVVGNNNIIIGHDIDSPGVPLDNDNKLSIGNLIFSDNIDGTGTTISSGNIGIGTSSPSQKLTVAGTIQATNLYGGAVNLTTDANGNIIRDPSDVRLKENIETLDDSLELLLELRGVRYNWIDKQRFGHQAEIGFIAQEVDEVLPEVVRKGGDYWSINTRNILAVVVEAVQEVWEVVTSNTSRIENIEQQLTQPGQSYEALEARIAELEAQLDIEPRSQSVTVPENDFENQTSPDSMPEVVPTATTSSTTSPEVAVVEVSATNTAQTTTVTAGATELPDEAATTEPAPADDSIDESSNASENNEMASSTQS